MSPNSNDVLLVKIEELEKRIVKIEQSTARAAMAISVAAVALVWEPIKAVLQGGGK